VRVLFDTNVLFSAFTAQGFCEEILERAIDRCVLVWSSPLRDELKHTLTRKVKLTVQANQAIAALEDLCEMVELSPLKEPVCRDPDDDVVLATALAGKVSYLVTGDQDLLVLHPYAGISIIAPRSFLDLLDHFA
jgi:putative PIN family toxin of toxin-antitoxin system